MKETFPYTQQKRGDWVFKQVNFEENPNVNTSPSSSASSSSQSYQQTTTVSAGSSDRSSSGTGHFSHWKISTSPNTPTSSNQQITQTFQPHRDAPSHQHHSQIYSGGEQYHSQIPLVGRQQAFESHQQPLDHQSNELPPYEQITRRQSLSQSTIPTTSMRPTSTFHEQDHQSSDTTALYDRMYEFLQSSMMNLCPDYQPPPSNTTQHGKRTKTRTSITILELIQPQRQ